MKYEYEDVNFLFKKNGNQYKRDVIYYETDRGTFT